MAKREKDEDLTGGAGPIAGRMTPAPAEPVVPVAAVVAERRRDQLAEEQAMLGRMTPLERALLAFDLEPRHVLGAGDKTLEDGTVQVTIVTRGGQRVRWPQDEGRVLSAMEKGDGVPTPTPAGIFPKR